MFFRYFFSSRFISVQIIFALMLLMFFTESMLGGSTSNLVLVMMGANSSHFVFQQHEWWRLVTSIFLHYGTIHFMVNSYVLIIMGMFLVQILGSARFFCLFITTGILASFFSALLSSGAISVGASGALWGMFGASAALVFRDNNFIHNDLREQLKKITLINIAINIFISMLPGIDIWAHFGGGISGYIFANVFILGVKGFIPASSRYLSKGEQRLWSGISTAFICLIVLCFIANFTSDQFISMYKYLK